MSAGTCITVIEVIYHYGNSCALGKFKRCLPRDASLLV